MRSKAKEGKNEAIQAKTTRFSQTKVRPLYVDESGIQIQLFLQWLAAMKNIPCESYHASVKWDTGGGYFDSNEGLSPRRHDRHRLYNARKETHVPLLSWYYASVNGVIWLHYDVDLTLFPYLYGRYQLLSQSLPLIASTSPGHGA
jgi:hypothetical protein